MNEHEMIRYENKTNKCITSCFVDFIFISNFHLLQLALTISVWAKLCMYEQLVVQGVAYKADIHLARYEISFFV